MKKIILILLLALVAASLYFTFFHRKGGPDAFSFNIKDTSIVSHIILSDTANKTDISRVSGQWMVNQTYHANQFLVKQLLRIFKNLDFSILIPDSQAESVNDQLMKQGIKVQFCEDDKVLREFWIGNYDKENNATLILNDEDLSAYVIATGLSKDIRKFIETDPLFWRDKQLFKLDIESIVGIELKDNENKENSFKILKKDNRFLLYNYNDQEQDYSSEKLSRYLSYYNNIGFDSLAVKSKESDSLWFKTPLYSITVKTITKQSIQLDLFTKKDKDNQEERDLNFVYGILNKENPVLVVSYFQIDPVLKSIDYFN